MIGTELLDDPAADPIKVRAQLGDLVRLNAWFGGTRAVVEALRPFFRGARGSTWTAVDVGAGSGDILRAAAIVARQSGVTLRGVAFELSRTAAPLARGGGLSAVVADGNALPLSDQSVDVAIASQVLHHLPPQDAVRWVAALDRIARRVVVVADLRRSRLAMAGLWLAGAPLGLDPSTRRDAITSLRRGYTRGELDRLLAAAGVPARSVYRPLARVVAAWVPACAR
jgi:methyltransferase family protein